MDQSPARALLHQSSARPAPPPALKVWQNVAFEELDDDDLAPVSVPVFSKQNSAQQRSAWASAEHSNLRASLPADLRHSRPGSPGDSWASPRSRSPAPGERASQPGNRNLDSQPHRLSHIGYAPSPSSRVSATGSEIYPLVQLFGRTSTSGSPTAAAVDERSHVSNININEDGVVCSSASSSNAAAEISAWQTAVKHLLPAATREEAVRLPAPASGLTRFYVTRQKGGLLGLQCTFRMFMEDGDVEVMSAVKSKQLAREGPTYTLYHAGETSGRKDGGNVVAQLAPNSSGTQYQLRSLTSSPSSAAELGCDLQLCISFEEQATRSDLRSMHCLVPCGSDTLPKSKEAAAAAQMAMLCTRQPDYSETTGYTLPIDNRFFITSIKNFQLVRWHLGSGSRGKQTLLQFGRISKDRFALDFAAPLTIKTAFAAALAAMEAKYMNSSQ